MSARAETSPGGPPVRPPPAVLVSVLLDSAPYGMVVLDPSDAVLVVNRHAQDLLGRPSLATAEDLAALAPPEQRGRIRERLKAARAEDPRTREMTLPLEVALVQPDGRERDVEITIMPIDSATGRLVSVAIVDVSARRALERAIEQRNRDLQQFNTLASHDLQEPLRTVISYCELLEARAGPSLDERSLRYTHHAAAGARRMQVLLDGLLEYSRLGREPLRLRPTDPAKVAEEAVSALAAQIQASGAVVAIGAMPPRVETDPVLLRQVFQNLVANALKFHGGAPPQVEVTGTSGERDAEFVVADRGIGITPGQEDRIFDMFRRLHTSAEYAGSGIGLAFARRIVESHGGRIWATNRPEGGASFHFTIPRPP